MELGYKETLIKAREQNIDLLTLSIASECDSIFCFTYTEDEFERLCARVRKAFLISSRAEEWAVAYVINELIMEYDKSIKDILEMDIYELIDRVVWGC